MSILTPILSGAPAPPRHRAAVAGAPEQWRRGVKAEAWPYEGIDQTLGLIRRQADRHAHAPGVRGVAESVTRGLYGKDYLSELAALNYWASDPRNVRYFRDPARVELVKDADVIVQTKQADCDEFDVVFGAMAQVLRERASRAAQAAGLASQAGNFHVEPAVAGFEPAPGFSHTFARVLDPRGSKRMVVMDPVAGPLTGRMLRQIRHFRVGEIL